MSTLTDHFMMMTPDELAAAMPLCQHVSQAGRRDMDMRTPITPEQGVALAAAISEWAGA